MANEASRTQGIARTVRLIGSLLSGVEHTRRTAAKLIGRKEPAAARQLEAIEQHLDMIEVRHKRGGRAYGLSSDEQVGETLSIGTAVAACFASSLAPLFAGSTYEASMRKATERVVEKAKRAKDFAEIDRKFVFHARGGEVSLPEKDDLLDELVEAVLMSHPVRLAYSHFGSEAEEVDVKPLSIIVYEHQLYVLCKRDSGKLHPYRFARISSSVRGRGTFGYPSRAEYDPVGLFGNSLGIFLDPQMPVQETVIRLHPRWAGYATSHRWHPSQEVNVLEGGVEVRLCVRQCPELCRWVLGFGDEAIVIAPDTLRAKVVEKLRRAAMAYAAPESTEG